MAAPRRALTTSLLRTITRTITRTTAVTRSTAPSIQLTATTTRTFVTPSTPITLSLRAQQHLLSPSSHRRRCYSTSNNEQEDEDRIPNSRIWDADQIKKQIEINKELEAAGRETAEDGKVIFVDVREPEEIIATGRIPGAINIPIVSAVQSFHISDQDFVDMHTFERPSKDAHLMFYCRAGVRAKTAAGLAQHAGWTKIGEYPGSWNDWEMEEGPVERVGGDGSCGEDA